MNRHFIDGVIYTAVYRRANPGDKIICIKDGDQNGRYYRAGDIGEALYESDEYPSIRVKLDKRCTRVSEECFVGNDSYHVLDPVENEGPTVDGTQASEQVIEILANLARRVTQLESQLADTQRNLEKFAEQTESNSEDIRTLDERTNEFSTTSKSGAKLLAEAFDALARYERSVGR